MFGISWQMLVAFVVVYELSGIAKSLRVVTVQLLQLEAIKNSLSIIEDIKDADQLTFERHKDKYRALEEKWWNEKNAGTGKPNPFAKKVEAPAPTDKKWVVGPQGNYIQQ